MICHEGKVDPSVMLNVPDGTGVSTGSLGAAHCIHQSRAGVAGCKTRGQKGQDFGDAHWSNRYKIHLQEKTPLGQTSFHISRRGKVSIGRIAIFASFPIIYPTNYIYRTCHPLYCRSEAVYRERQTKHTLGTTAMTDVDLNPRW